MFETKKTIYDKICRLLTDYEHPEPEDIEYYDEVDWEAEFYEMLVKIQNRWEDVITAED